MKTIAMINKKIKETNNELEEEIIEEFRLVPTCIGKVGLIKSDELDVLHLKLVSNQKENIEECIINEIKQQGNINITKNQIEEIGLIEYYSLNENKIIHKKINCYTVRLDVKQKKQFMSNQNDYKWIGLKKAYKSNCKLIKQNLEDNKHRVEENILIKRLIKCFSKQSSYDILIDFIFELVVFALAIVLWHLMKTSDKFSNVDIDVYIFIATVLILLSALGSDYVLRHLRRKRNTKNIDTDEIEDNEVIL